MEQVLSSPDGPKNTMGLLFRRPHLSNLTVCWQKRKHMKQINTQIAPQVGTKFFDFIYRKTP